MQDVTERKEIICFGLAYASLIIADRTGGDIELLRQFLLRQPGDHTRLAGKMQFHYRLAFGEDGRPMLQVFNTCKHFIRTIPNLVYDESNVEDIDTTQEDHIYDECRYVLMENPISAAKHTQPPPMLDDPLDMDPRKDKTRFMRI